MSAVRELTFDNFVHVEFGLGAVIIGKTSLDGKFGVALAPSTVLGEPGRLVIEDEEIRDEGIVLWFPTEEQRDGVHKALTTRP